MYTNQTHQGVPKSRSTELIYNREVIESLCPVEVQAQPRTIESRCQERSYNWEDIGIDLDRLCENDSQAQSETIQSQPQEHIYDCGGTEKLSEHSWSVIVESLPQTYNYEDNTEGNSIGNQAAPQEQIQREHHIFNPSVNPLIHG
ncbi:hypothetical protein BGZ76_005178, partial [Entomortierella beljakovae]